MEKDLLFERRCLQEISVVRLNLGVRSHRHYWRISHKVRSRRQAFKGSSKAEIELLFGRLDLIAPALAAGVLLYPPRRSDGKAANGCSPQGLRRGYSVTMRQAGWIGAIQGFCLPLRGFSRSGATISTGMLTGASKERAERFSFALAVVVTPAAIGREVLRLVKASHVAVPPQELRLIFTPTWSPACLARSSHSSQVSSP